MIDSISAALDWVTETRLRRALAATAQPAVLLAIGITVSPWTGLLVLASFFAGYIAITTAVAGLLSRQETTDAR